MLFTQQKKYMNNLFCTPHVLLFIFLNLLRIFLYSLNLIKFLKNLSVFVGGGFIITHIIFSWTNNLIFVVIITEFHLSPPAFFRHLFIQVTFEDFWTEPFIQFIKKILPVLLPMSRDIIPRSFFLDCFFNYWSVIVSSLSSESNSVHRSID